ncbi:MAG: GNAT family N-acetyltransferase [Pseudohongiella sp.]|uniref:GNAT family N-acetyltransferase n=1 Tax=Pseudohongiella sp. TaxID=1979412 RepID=UPI0034A0659B
MTAIITSTVSAEDLEIYRQWVSGEWGSEHSFDPPEGSPSLPSPLLALTEGELSGGISFTWYPNPGRSEQALWINTLYVESESRGNGYALDLIAAAEQCAKGVACASELFVYTDAPGLYGKRNWSILSQDGKMTVLCKKL